MFNEQNGDFCSFFFVIHNVALKLSDLSKTKRQGFLKIFFSDNKKYLKMQ